MTEYRIRYALYSACGMRIVHAVIYHSTKEVYEAIKGIYRIGYEFIGLDSRPAGHYNSLYDGWDCSDDEDSNNDEKNFGFFEIGG